MMLHWKDRHEWSMNIVESSLVAMFDGLGHVYRIRATNLLSLNILYVHIDIFLFPENLDTILRTKA